EGCTRSRNPLVRVSRTSNGLAVGRSCLTRLFAMRPCMADVRKCLVSALWTVPSETRKNNRERERVRLERTFKLLLPLRGSRWFRPVLSFKPLITALSQVRVLPGLPFPFRASIVSIAYRSVWQPGWWGCHFCVHHAPQLDSEATPFCVFRVPFGLAHR